MTRLNVNSFALRHTVNSKFSHYNGTWTGLCTLVLEHFDNYEKLNEEGTMRKVRVPASGFQAGMVALKEGDEVNGTFAKRERALEGEQSFLQTTTPADKTPAEFVEIVIYAKEALDKDATHDDSDWEVVSINAALVSDEPPHPMTIWRNMREKTGGTKNDYTTDEMLDSIEYWFTHAHPESKE